MGGPGVGIVAVELPGYGAVNGAVTCVNQQDARWLKLEASWGFPSRSREDPRKHDVSVKDGRKSSVSAVRGWHGEVIPLWWLCRVEFECQRVVTYVTWSHRIMVHVQCTGRSV